MCLDLGLYSKQQCRSLLQFGVDVISKHVHCYFVSLFGLHVYLLEMQTVFDTANQWC